MIRGQHDPGPVVSPDPIEFPLCASSWHRTAERSIAAGRGSRISVVFFFRVFFTLTRGVVFRSDGITSVYARYNVHETTTTEIHTTAGVEKAIYLLFCRVSIKIYGSATGLFPPPRATRPLTRFPTPVVLRIVIRIIIIIMNLSSVPDREQWAAATVSRENV